MNVLNVEAVERELKRCASYARHLAVRQWVMTVPRNYFLSHLEEKDMEANFVVYTDSAKRNPLHIEMPTGNRLPPWAKAALERGETLHWFDTVQVRRRNFWLAVEQIVHWFNNWPDNDRRLPRLSHMNFETTARAAAMFMSKVQSNLWDYIKDKPPVVMEMADGYRWIQMKTPLHFERESRLMNHCVGNGHYYNQYKRGSSAYFSLRDRQNRPHVTMEVLVDVVTKEGQIVGKVAQCKGRCNAKPIPQYQRHIWPFLKAQGWPIAGDSHNIDVPAGQHPQERRSPGVWTREADVDEEAPVNPLFEPIPFADEDDVDPAPH